MKKKQTTLHDGLERAKRGKYAIGAFNVSSIEATKAVVNAAVKLKAPVIIEVSGGESEYIGTQLQAAMTHSLRNTTGLPIFVNLDHSKTVPATLLAVDAGYDLVHFDGSELPLFRNITALRKVVPYAHRHKVIVEGEMDHITGSSDWHRNEKAASKQPHDMYTNPDAAADFVRKTGVDIFASFIGNVHGVYSDAERLDLGLLKTLRTRLRCHLSLHGGSGIRAQDVRRAIALGINKVNVNTEIRMAHITALRKELGANPDEMTWYKLMPPVIAAMQRVIEEKIRLFGSAGKA